MIYLCLRERGKEKEICFFRRKMPRKGNGSFNQGGGGDEGRMMKQLFFFSMRRQRLEKIKKQLPIAQSVTQWLFISTTDALVIKSL